MFCQPHRVTSGQTNSQYKFKTLLKLFSSRIDEFSLKLMATVQVQTKCRRLLCREPLRLVLCPGTSISGTLVDSEHKNTNNAGFCFKKNPLRPISKKKKKSYKKYILSISSYTSWHHKHLTLINVCNICHLVLHQCIGGTFQTTARFQDSDFLQKAIKMVLRWILIVIFNLSGFKL